MLVYLFLYISRVSEYVTLLQILRPSAVLFVFLTGAAIISGRALVVPNSNTGRWIIAFTAWVALSIPFSSWRGGSFQAFVGLLKAIAIVVFVACFAWTVRECMRAMYLVGVGVVVATLEALVVGATEGGRLISGGSTLGDPNYFCLYLLIGLAFLWLKARTSSWIGRAVILILSVLIWKSVIDTASRMGVVVAAVGGVFVIWHSSRTRKVWIGAAAIVLAGSSLVVMPERFRARLSSVFNEDVQVNPEDLPDLNAAIASSQIRRDLILRGAILTLQNPLFGVGPNQFSQSSAEIVRAETGRENWFAAHNNYLQISSETGIPGLVFFAGAMIAAYRAVGRIRRGAPGESARMAAFHWQIAMIMAATGGLFLSMPFGGFQYVLLGLAISLENAAKRELAPARAADSGEKTPSTSAPPGFRNRLQ
jgi:O-antigen ligase